MWSSDYYLQHWHLHGLLRPFLQTILPKRPGDSFAIERTRANGRGRKEWANGKDSLSLSHLAS